jgi:hypothetical protein
MQNKIKITSSFHSQAPPSNLYSFPSKIQNIPMESQLHNQTEKKGQGQKLSWITPEPSIVNENLQEY